MPRHALGVLVVDDSEPDFRSTRALFESAGDAAFTVHWAPTYEAGLTALVAGTCDVCFVDYDLEGRSGLDLVREAREHGARTPMVLLNGHDSCVADEDVLRSGVDDCISKWQLTPALLERSVRYAMDGNRARACARDSHQRLQALADNMSAIYFEGDPWTQRLLYVSPAYEAILGQSCADACAVPRAWLEFVHRDDHERVVASFDESPYADLEFRIVRSSGAVRWLRRRSWVQRDDSGRVTRIAGTAEDVTAIRVAQRQTAATSRLEALGRLVGGVAHDFNNMLTAIIGEAELLGRDLGACDPRYPGVREIIGASNRAADLTRQLLAFGRQKTFDPGELDLNALVHRVRGMLARLVGSEIELVLDLPDDVGFAVADASQMEQVVINLVVNARDAMPAGGRLAIATRNVTREEDSTAPDSVRPGSWVVLSVTDEGTGMADDVQACMFEPFFTTKAPDEGSGLGLSTVRDLVERSGGAIVVHSEWGAGSTFDVYLPRATHGGAR